RRLEDAMDPANATRYFLSQAAQVAGNKLRSSNIADKVQGTSISANGYEKNRKNAIAELLKFDKKLNFTGFAEGGSPSYGGFDGMSFLGGFANGGSVSLGSAQ